MAIECEGSGGDVDGGADGGPHSCIGGRRAGWAGGASDGAVARVDGPDATAAARPVTWAAGVSVLVCVCSRASSSSAEGCFRLCKFCTCGW